jgi:hypothetical protein
VNRQGKDVIANFLAGNFDMMAAKKMKTCAICASYSRNLASLISLGVDYSCVFDVQIGGAVKLTLHLNEALMCSKIPGLLHWMQIGCADWMCRLDVQIGQASDGSDGGSARSGISHYFAD